jgi:hypothetical protein
VGAWGAGAFENDDAADWVIELEASDNADVLRRALSLEVGGYVELPEGAIAVAAAEVVATGLGRPGSGLPSEVIAWTTAHASSIGADERQLALDALDRVLAPASEIAELWAEANDPEWRDGVLSLRQRLSA